MSEVEQLNACVVDMFTIFANMLSKHTLKKNMSAAEILSLLGLDSGAVSSKTSPFKAHVVYDGDIDDMPEGLGLSKKRALKVLACCQQGVPDDHYVHSQKGEVFKPTKQHDKFYKDEKSRIAGPVGKDGKEKKAIKWLAKKAGKVGPPPEEEVVAKLPSKWGSDRKKVRNMLDKVKQNDDDEKYTWDETLFRHKEASTTSAFRQ